jgi:Raf kinase inhibitor-like YbhB/YbcL family protein
MREILPKIIGGVVVLAVIGGGAAMVMRHKNPTQVEAPGMVPGAASSLPPPPATTVVQETRKYKRDMLGYVPDTAAAATAVSPAKPEPAHTAASVATSGLIPGVAPGAAATSSNTRPAPAPAEYAGRIKLQMDKLANEIKLESAQLKPGEKISLYYSCNQKNVSPPLNWAHAPSGTKSFVVMLEGPDKGRGQPLQWGVYNIPASQTSLGEAVPKVAMDDKGMGQAQTELGPIGYAGPCIPKGESIFVFSVYALDIELKLYGGATRNELIKAMNGHVIDMAKLPVTHYFRL